MEQDTKKKPPVSDERIVEMYWQRNQDAILETDHKYGGLLQKVAYNILCDPLDCEECRNDTYFRIWNLIPSAKPAPFSAFVVRVMRGISIDRYREKNAKKRIPSQLTVSMEELKSAISSDHSVEEMYEAKALAKLISKYIRTLTERQKYIFLDRYYMAETVETIAADLAISEQTVYRELQKIKQGLKEYLEGNGVRI